MRNANHLAITDSGTVHLADDAKVRPYHVLACNGRAVDAMGVSFNHVNEQTAEAGPGRTTCRSCRSAYSAGRITIIEAASA